METTEFEKLFAIQRENVHARRMEWEDHKLFKRDVDFVNRGSIVFHNESALRDWIDMRRLNQNAPFDERVLDYYLKSAPAFRDEGRLPPAAVQELFRGQDLRIDTVDAFCKRYRGLLSKDRQLTLTVLDDGVELGKPPAVGPPQEAQLIVVIGEERHVLYRVLETDPYAQVVSRAEIASAS